MNNLPTQSENPNGLHQRYYLKKIIHMNVKYKDGSKEEVFLQDVDEGSEYFVLRLDEGTSDPEHLAACRIAIHAYADAIEHHLPKLASDLRERYSLL